MMRLRYYLPMLMWAYTGALQLHAQSQPSVDEGQYYQLIDVPIPDDINLEAGGLAFDDQGNLGVCTRRGELWVIENPNGASPLYTRFAHGLHEPLGLAYHDGSYYLAQRGELSKVTDTDGDGLADQYDAVYTWPLAGNYHEYSYGPKVLPNGDMLVTLNLGWVGRGASLSKWRGWMLKIGPDGTMTPIATGMRSPAGFGMNAEGDIFYTENQGDWVGSGRMTHIQKGDFVGHPEGLKWSAEPNSPIDLNVEDIDDTRGLSLYQYGQEIPAVKPPSVWFPHTLMGISTSDIIVIPEGFGPFTGQLLVGDQGHSKVMRVYQEQVNGVYQGICFSFREGFSSGVLRLEWSSENSLFVGMTNRGWASTGASPFGLQRLIWTGKKPFEIKTVKIQSDGFAIEFTMPVDRAIAEDPANYQITDFTYKYHHLYGSPVVDQQNRSIVGVRLDEKGSTVHLSVGGLREGYIYEIKAEGVRNQAGDPLLHPTGYYTLNQLPEGTNVADSHDTVLAHSLFEEVDVRSPKRILEMPDNWINGPDLTLTVGTLPGLQYDKKEIRVKAGNKIKLVFENPDDMMHNLLIVTPNSADEVAQAALNLGLQGMQEGYIPDHEEVLYHTNLLTPHSSDVIYFTAPDEPGSYPYVCTFPGHGALMRGMLIVEPAQ